MDMKKHSCAQVAKGSHECLIGNLHVIAITKKQQSRVFHIVKNPPVYKLQKTVSHRRAVQNVEAWALKIELTNSRNLFNFIFEH